MAFPAVDFLFAVLPIIWLFFAFLILKLPGYLACLIAMLVTAAESLLFKLAGFGGDMAGLTAGEALTAAVEGVVSALWPISFIIIAAMFTYNLCVETGAMDLIKHMLISVTNDRRIMVLLLSWGFGGFIEAVAGGGTPVAIPGAMLAALGFDPLFCAVVCMIANAAPPTFGSIGIPITTAAGLVGADALSLAGPAARLLAIPAFLSPFLIVWLTGRAEGAKGMFRGVLGFTALASLSYVIPALLTAHFVGAEFVDLVGSTVSLAAMVLAARAKRPLKDSVFLLRTSDRESITCGSARFGYGIAFAPYLLMLVLLVLSSRLVGPVNRFLARFTTEMVIYSGAGANTVTLPWLGNSGVMIFLAGAIEGMMQGATFGIIGKVLARTCRSMWKAIATIVCSVALAKLMVYSGMTSQIATTLAAQTGSFFPALSPVIGMIGSFVTGSTTPSGILFAGMQVEVAEQIGVDATRLVAANMVGGAIGKLISPQSIAVAIAAIGLDGSEGKIMAQTVRYWFLFGLLLCMTSYALT